MRRTALIALVTSAALALPAAAAAEPVVQRVTGPLGAVTITVDNAQSFTEAACRFLPVTVAWVRSSEATIHGDLRLTKVGAAAGHPDPFVLVPGEPTTGTLTTYAYACPADGPGEYVLDGEVSFGSATAPVVMRAIEPVTITVRAARSRITGLALRRAGAGHRLSGRATAGSGKAGGVLVVSARPPGTRTWTNVAVPRLAADGRFTVTLPGAVPAGSTVRVEVRSCSWCTPARAFTRLPR